jgi:flavodoxin
MLILTLIFSNLVNVSAADGISIVLGIDSPVMLVNGKEKAVDSNGTSPVIIDGRTLVPVRAIVEEMGGSVGWSSETQTAVLEKDGNIIELVIGSTQAKFNDEIYTLDTEPVIINERTMLPIRFIAENFGFDVDWNKDTRTITISDEHNEKTTQTNIAETVTETTQNDSKALIVYFSRAGENYGVGTVEIGNTAHIANFIEEKTNADVFEIVPEEPYSSVYDECVERAKQEQNENARPKYIGEANNLEQYDTIYIGYPIWWGTMPMVVKTFLENNDLSGKTVIPFSTNAGSGWGSSLTDLKNLCPNSTIIDGFSIAGTNAKNAQKEVNAWLDGLKKE